MKSVKQGLLAAAAVAALIAGATAVQAQADKKMEVQGGVQVEGGADVKKDVKKKGNAQTGSEARGGVQAQGGAKTEAQGGAKTEAQGGAKTEAQGGAKTGTQTTQGGAQGGGGADVQKKSGQTQPMDQGGKKSESAQGSQSDSKASVQLNEQQRTSISQTIRQKGGDFKRVDRTRINFTINVGAVVPRTFGLYPLPATIITFVPAYRGYLYIVVGDDLLIIHPRTYEIVAIIPA
ncbi:MAG: DUF1236 domain-containing protein [Xanthobacteraceae bacterium]